jgi:hypothetical protein
MPAYLEAGLDMFAQFFIAPLMNEGSTARELNSIESEFSLSKNSDSCRLQELWCATSAPEGHPFGNFTWGSKYSHFRVYMLQETACICVYTYSVCVYACTDVIALLNGVFGHLQI